MIGQMVEIDAAGIHYRELNEALRGAIGSGANHVTLRNVTGQRYIGTNLHAVLDPEALKSVTIEIFGTPGNDLGTFLDGPTIIVRGSVMDGSGNTMNDGRIIVHGRAGDITGFSARGGEILVRDDAGYRVGIHMKEYQQKRPVLVIGGTVQDFLGEYMAGGVVIVMGLTLSKDEYHTCASIGAGMHGGSIFIRGGLDELQLGTGVGISELTDENAELLSRYIRRYAEEFDVDMPSVHPSEFLRLGPTSHRPYQQMYAY
jgi:glutamate synthase domain-containing protein 3